jgi:hypothetical protein
LNCNSPVSCFKFFLAAQLLRLKDLRRTYDFATLASLSSEQWVSVPLIFRSSCMEDSLFSRSTISAAGPLCISGETISRSAEAVSVLSVAFHAGDLHSLMPEPSEASHVPRVSGSCFLSKYHCSLDIKKTGKRDRLARADCRFNLISLHTENRPWNLRIDC